MEDSQSDMEMGYLFVEDCDAFINQASTPLSQTWVDVDLSKTTQDIQQGGCQCDECHDITLVTSQKEELQPALHLLNKEPRYDGTVGDMYSKCSSECCACHQSNAERRQKRSDVSLIIGLALTCQSLGHVKIKNALIRTTSSVKIKEERSTEKRSIYEQGSYQPISLAITFGFPNLFETGASICHKNSSKPLPYSTQLLLSLIRCDWDVFEGMLRCPTTHTTSGKLTKLAFFPQRLGLDKLYHQITGAKAADISLNSQNTESQLLSLPNEVLTSQIATFLRAPSLRALAGTCKQLDENLCSVVPGLSLALYNHQIKSLRWMRSRERYRSTENDLITKVADSFSYDGDSHRAATGGATTKLVSRRPTGPKQMRMQVRVSQYTGIVFDEDNPIDRSIAKGGLLCDDPGLGKTITILSLILQTAGVPERSVEQVSDDQSEQRIFAAYWKEQLVPEFRVPLLNKLLVQLMQSSKLSTFFLHPVDPVTDECPDYFEIVKKPVCIRQIQKNVGADVYGADFEKFQEDIELCFRNAKLFNPVEHAVHVAADQMLRAFEAIVRSFKTKQTAIACKAFGRGSARPNSSVAVLIEEIKRKKFLKALIPSSGTLLVVPSVLLGHWQDQIRRHINPTYCDERIPITFEFNGSIESAREMETIMLRCDVEKSHTAFLFVDKSNTKTLPPPAFLAKFTIVITTNQRFSNEWKHGSFEAEVHRHPGSDADLFDSENACACPLLKVNWLRLVVDEGHSMGRNMVSASIRFAAWICARRRWAMTGTPTRNTVTDSGLSSILNLVCYLQHEFFSHHRDGIQVWQNLIVRSWNLEAVCSFFRLKALLASLMIRHTKNDIEELPSPHFTTTVLPMSYEEVTTYNTIVCAIQSNLLITSMEGMTSGAQDSLLHKSQLKHAQKALLNLRLVCVGGTRVIPTLSDKFWDEFVHDFDICKPPESKKQRVLTYVQDALAEKLTRCDCCQLSLSTLLVFPCGCLLCTECADAKSNQCVMCDDEFDIDTFQKLQPGMDYQWHHNLELDMSKSKKKAAVNQQNIPLQANPNLPGAALNGGQGHQVIRGQGNRPGNHNARRRRSEKRHACKYDPLTHDGICTVCFKEHDSCILIVEACCNICFRKAEQVPASDSKASYIVQKLLKLSTLGLRLREQAKMQQSATISNFHRPLKVIIFSQFRIVLNMVGDRLLRRFGGGCVAEYWGKLRSRELQRFQRLDDCFCFLLGKDGSEGLDLSFVTNIIFLEKVLDKSLEEQVVARAWRMGAKGAVAVETLIAQDSVEETLRDMEGPSSPTDTTGDGPDKGQATKVHYLLQNARLIANTFTMSYGGTATNSDKRRACIALSHIKVGEDKMPHESKPRQKKARFNI